MEKNPEFPCVLGFVGDALFSESRVGTTFEPLRGGNAQDRVPSLFRYTNIKIIRKLTTDLTRKYKIKFRSVPTVVKSSLQSSHRDCFLFLYLYSGFLYICLLCPSSSVLTSQRMLIATFKSRFSSSRPLSMICARGLWQRFALRLPIFCFFVNCVGAPFEAVKHGRGRMFMYVCHNSSSEGRPAARKSLLHRSAYALDC